MAKHPSPEYILLTLVKKTTVINITVVVTEILSSEYGLYPPLFKNFLLLGLTFLIKKLS